jgi:uncharacterized coiled-coil protein SlyX
MYCYITLITPADGVVLAGFVCLILFTLYEIWCKRKDRTIAPTPSRKRLSRTQAGRNLDIGTQAGRDVIHKYKGSKNNELLFFTQCKDMQNTIDRLFNTLEAKTRTIEAYQVHMKAQVDKIEALQEENFALWQERARLEMESRTIQFPVLDYKKETA